MRQVYQAYREAEVPRAKMDLKAFGSRLRWQGHFIQKFESECRIEFESVNRGYADFPYNGTPESLEAWKRGQTGIPLIDACMRCVTETGYLNFRMRAMLVSFASYDLWLHWRQPAIHLARLFADYEPGIHYPQFQMQSGTTGINTIRIYNPVKQGYDQDPTGAFTRRWVPELVEVEDRFLQEPWKSEGAVKILGTRYPLPMVDHLSAAKEARAKIWAVRRRTDFKSQAKTISDKHGSRRSGIKMRGQRPKKTHDGGQLKFSFDTS